MSWLRRLFTRKQMETDLDKELRFHLEAQVADKIRSGISESEARRLTRLEFGGIDQIKEGCRESRGTMWVESVVQDVRYGLRQLRKSPGFTMVVVLTLALGIGANTAVFTLVNAVMLRSLPVRDPQQLVVAEWSARNRPRHLRTSSFGDCQDYQGMRSDCSLSYPMFQQIRDQKNLFANAMAFAGPAQLDLSGNGVATIVQGELVSGSYFETLGVIPALGRTLGSEDEKPEAEPVVVLDYGYWQRAFGGSPNVIGRTIRLNNTAFTIVGVADSRFTRLTQGKSVDLWVPLTQGTQLGQEWTQVNTSNTGNLGADSTRWWLVVVGRLQSGVSRKQAQAAVNAIFVNDALHGTKPVWTAADDPHLWLLPVQQGLSGIRPQYGKPLMLLMAAVGIVLLIACANVAGLMLARSAAREREMAVRLAVGAGRRRVIRQLLTESLLLSSLGAAFGALLAYVGATGLAAFFSSNSYSPLRLDLEPDGRVLLFAIGAAVLTGIGFGLAPAFRGARANVATELKGNSTTIGHGARERLGLGKGLVVMQVALSMIVLVGAGLLLRTLDKLHSIDPGFDTRNILLFSIDPELAGYNKRQISDLYTNLQGRLAALPGVVNCPIIHMRTQSDAIDRLLFNERLVARLFGLFGALGLMLASIGLYGLLSYDVTRRTREIGIRTALGAQRRDVLLLVLQQGLVLVIVGVALGAGAAIGVTRLLESLLYGVRPTDPLTYIIVSLVLTGAALLACYVPARRAMKIDPMVALRYE